MIHVECVVETFGTFFLALAVMFSHNLDTAAIAVGLMLTALITIGGHISGGHYNPAVTLAMWLYYKKIETSEALLYVMCQFIGVGLASFVYQLLTSNLWAAQSANATMLQSASNRSRINKCFMFRLLSPSDYLNLLIIISIHLR